jgi:hypothetical protein
VTQAAATADAWASRAGLSCETRALLACALAVLDPGRSDEAAAAVALCGDGDRLCETAAAHGMTGHLYGVLAGRQASVREALPRLAELQRAAAERGLRQTARLLRLLERFESAGITAMPYKGPAWGERFYGDLTLRSWVDLDVIVAHSQLAAAREVLLAEGFVDDSPFSERIMAQKAGGLGEIPFSALAGDIHLELHWEATVGVGARAITAEKLMARAGTMPLLGREVRTPSDVDAMLLTCLNGTKDRWARVEALLCAGVQIRDLAPPLWPAVVAEAREAGCLRRVLVAVAHTCRVFGLETPAGIAASAARDPGVGRLLAVLTPESLERGCSLPTRGDLNMITWRVVSEDSLPAGVAHALARFFRPGPEDWDWLTLPRGAGWLYPVLRPARLAAKWARRL